MNHYHVFFALTILLTIMACDPERFKQDFSSGKAIMMLNGEEWIGAGDGILHEDTAYFGFRTYNSYGDLRQTISFSKIPCVVGEYKLYESISDSLWLPRAVSSFITSSSDGDVQEDVYTIWREMDVSESTLEIVEWNAAEFALRGYVNANYTLKYGHKVNPANPDTIVVKSGEFIIKLR